MEGNERNLRGMGRWEVLPCFFVEGLYRDHVAQSKDESFEGDVFFVLDNENDFVDSALG